MTTVKMSSDEARSKWREILDAAVAGNQIVIERYGKPVAVIVPHSQYVQSSGQVETVREETTVYQTGNWEAIKAELINEIKTELLQALELQEALSQAEQPAPKKAVNISTPRLVHPEQAADFKKEIVAELPDAEV
ncbi:MAG: hypothetical protein CL608_06705 [Anaerolineaceae bacterium]|nr:hypothetical protein [Anaerolineaceae bacterium]